MRISLLGMLLGIISLWAVAQSPLNDQVPDEYVVKRGDTLWDISGVFLRHPWMWPEIWHVNPQISNPHLIYPGDVIRLIYVDGQPRLTVNRGRDVHLSPQIREMAHAEAIPAIPLDVINNFLSRTRVVGPGELEAAPYVLAGTDRRILTGMGDDLYARGELPDGIAAFGLYRQGDNYVDPDTGELLGIQAEDVGTARVRAVEGDIATLGASRSTREIRPGDRLLPHEERRIAANFYPSSSLMELDGQIIGVEGGVSQVGRLSVVALNRGARDGLIEGNVLAIYKRGESIVDRVRQERVTLPAERAGVLMVFRTFEKMSFALVMEADRSLSVGDLLRMP